MRNQNIALISITLVGVLFRDAYSDFHFSLDCMCLTLDTDLT
jgi:hypothetical protein